MNGTEERYAIIHNTYIDQDFMNEMFNLAKIELEGLLAPNEAAYIVDALNGALYSAGINPTQFMVLQVVESAQYENTDKKWDVNTSELADKLSNLTTFQSLTLIYCSDQFWSNNIGTNCDLEAEMKKHFGPIIK